MANPPTSPTTVRTRGLEIAFGQATDAGLDPAKAVNEDSCGYAETSHGHLFVVCDGMGGHSGGKQASDVAIRTIFDHMGSASADQDPGDVLIEAIEAAARQVFDLGGAPTNQQRPGSTCVALLLHDGVTHIAHVGDSRAYALRGDQAYRLTKDHSMVQELIDSGALDEREAMGHPDSNKITRALGMAPVVEVELRPEPMELHEGDVFLLSSDGLTDLVDAEDFLAVVPAHLGKKDIQGACDELVALANRRGGFDNITVQLVHILRTKPGAGKTLPQEPSDAAAGSPVPTTIKGAPVVGDTVVQAPALEPPADKPIPGGIAGAPDMQEAPTLIRPAKRGVSTTKPEAPAPVTPEAAGPVTPDPASRDATGPVTPDPASREPAGPVTPDPAVHRPSAPQPVDLDYDPLDSDPPSPPTLVYVVVGMAVVISILLALLIWALFYR